MPNDLAKFGSVRLHTFEDGNTVYNISLYQDMVEKLVPENGKLHLNIIEHDGALMLVDGGNWDNVKLRLTMDAPCFTPGMPNAVTYMNGYASLVAAPSSKDGEMKDVYALYQPAKKNDNLAVTYVGYAAKTKPLNLAGPVFHNEPAGGFPYSTCSVPRDTLTTASSAAFLNVFPSKGKETSFAVLDSKPNPAAQAILRIPRRSVDMLLSSFTGDTIFINYSSRNPETVQKDDLAANLNVYTLVSKEKSYVGAGWTGEHFNSLSPDQQQQIASGNRNIAAAPPSLEQWVNKVVSFSVADDYYLSKVMGAGPYTAYGVVSDAKPETGKLQVDAPCGSFYLKPSEVAESSKLHLSNFTSVYTQAKQWTSSKFQQQRSEDIKKDNPSPDKAQQRDGEKAKATAAKPEHQKVVKPKGNAKPSKEKGADQGLSI